MKSGMFYGAPPIIFEFAKSLRNKVTPAENIMWEKLKEHFPGLKFRRQHPIFFYIADFFCHAHKLIIEIDGSIHSLPDVKVNDVVRQKELEDLGLKVLKFRNNEITNFSEAAIKKIEASLRNPVDRSGEKAPRPPEGGTYRSGECGPSTTWE